MGGPKNPTNAGANYQEFNSGGILKRDRLVSGLVHINVMHRPDFWEDRKRTISVEFVDSTPGVYSSGNTGKYLSIYTDEVNAHIFWFKDTANTVQPQLTPPQGGTFTYVIVNITAFYNLAGGAVRIAETCNMAMDGNAQFDGFFIRWIMERDITAPNDKKKDHIIFLRWSRPDDDVLASSHNVNSGYFKIHETGGDETGVAHKRSLSSEADFKQMLFNNTTVSSQSNISASRRSPYDSSEPPPWRGELYDDNRFNNGTNDDSHPLGGRYGSQHHHNPDGLDLYNASLGDHATYLYYVTAATKVSDNPRPWGTKVINGNAQHMLQYNGQWSGDFNKSIDITNWLVSSQQVFRFWLSQSQTQTDPSIPYPTGSMQMRFTNTGNNSTADYGQFNVMHESVTVQANSDAVVFWDILQNSVNDPTAGSGLFGLEIRTHQVYASGQLVAAAPGGGVGGSGISSSGGMEFTVPQQVTQVFVFFVVINTVASGGGANAVWQEGRAELNMCKLVPANAKQHEDELNAKYGTPMGDSWWTQKPDDGLTFLWVRSHCISHHNNEEPYNDNWIIQSHRCQFIATTDAAEEAGVINLGYDGSFQGSYYARGSDVVDNYNFKQWKNFKPGDLVKVTGSAEAANNGVFQLRWDWDWNSEYMYGYTTGDTPANGGPWPNMKFRLCPYRVLGNGTQSNAHTLVTTELTGQLFTEDITITSGGTYIAQYQNAKIPLVFTATPAVDMAGYAEFQDDTTPVVDNVVITNPGTGFNLASANSLVITVQASNGSSIGITAIADGGLDFSHVTADAAHGLFVGQIVVVDTVDNYYDGVHEVTAIDSNNNLKFTINKAFTNTTTGTFASYGAATNSPATFSHTAPANLNVSDPITIENLTRRWSDSSNSKSYDYSIDKTAVDDPVGAANSTELDSHGVPFVGRPGNNGRVSALNHNYDAYVQKSFNGMFESGSRAMHHSELHEHEGRMAGHHAMETFHHPVAGTPEIYGKRGMTIPDKRNPFEEFIQDNDGEYISNPEYIPSFANGAQGTVEGNGFKYYDRQSQGLYHTSGVTFGDPKLTVQVPIKGYKTHFEEGGNMAGALTTDVLYDVNVEVMFQPFGETNQIKLEKGDNLQAETMK